MSKRFKTEKEFIEEFGIDWKESVEWNFFGEMDLALGEPFNKTGSDLKIPRCESTWKISEKMLTDKPLLPIGTKVAIPLNKMPGTEYQGEHNSIGVKQGYFYYSGIYKSSNANHHQLHYDNKLNSGNFYYASEILEAYERFQKEQYPLTPNQVFQSEIKVGSYVRCKPGFEAKNDSGGAGYLSGRKFIVSSITSSTRDQKVEKENIAWSNTFNSGVWFNALELITREEFEGKTMIESNPVEPYTYKVGDWVLYDNSENYFIKECIIQITKNDNHYWTNVFNNFLRHDNWKTTTNFCICKSNIKRLATNDEIKETLISIAKEKYPVGTKFHVAHINNLINNTDSIHKIIDNSFKFENISNDVILCNKSEDIGKVGYISCVYYRGKWAEIIKEDKPKFDIQKAPSISLTGEESSLREFENILLKIGYKQCVDSPNYKSTYKYLVTNWADHKKEFGYNQVKGYNSKKEFILPKQFNEALDYMGLSEYKVIQYRSFNFPEASEISQSNYSSVITVNNKISINQKQTKNNGEIIKVQRKVATISSSERRTGSTISGRRGRATITRGHNSYQEINCK